MAEMILCVFEGQKTEPKIFESLKANYFPATQNTIIHATFDTDIYQLWRKVQKDADLDLLEIVRDINTKNTHTLHGINRDQVSQIYLFFDYDGHAQASQSASDADILGMLNHFNNETENGKLFISYPMVEAFKHIKKDVDFRTTFFEVKKGTEYKNLVHEATDFRDITQLDKGNWGYIIRENYVKANIIFHDEEPEVFKNDIEQYQIFDVQLEKYIKPKGIVAVLSAFPFFILEYFGARIISA